MTFAWQKEQGDWKSQGTRRSYFKEDNIVSCQVQLEIMKTQQEPLRYRILIVVHTIRVSGSSTDVFIISSYEPLLSIDEPITGSSCGVIFNLLFCTISACLSTKQNLVNYSKTLQLSFISFLICQFISSIHFIHDFTEDDVIPKS